ncbi:hypothetical protein F0P96_10540 [Hymenobacter busanensis]|uniref:Uncharacterized protein n=1 Tax=Hymenobacter busanensis TaxID=2607656 RepID=A0A7L5A0I5_9BACT|nr:hypothetical protein [Hymenobacter busanensis]KAA9333398.1 hypothetical protein F0P96_10540 [Hymenobacter busanensis]QHJ07922.1 hypothetical protein GUY19_11765 [Hymenobacter busanensis]
MATKRYKLQLGQAPAETVGQEVIDALKQNRTLHKYDVTELPAEKEAAKPSDLRPESGEGEKSAKKNTPAA